jgi:hypothetical protein
MPPLFYSTSVRMKDETRDRRRDLLLALPASLVLHALIIALLVYGLPMPPQLQQEQQAINVTLVPPAAQPKSKPAPPPSLKEVNKPPEPKAEKPPLPEKQPPKPPRIEVLKPVFQFGDKDTGPSKSMHGGSAQENSLSPAKDDDSKPPLTAKGSQNTSAISPGSEEGPDAGKDAEKQATTAKDAESALDVEKLATSSQDIDKQETDKQGTVAHDADEQTAAAATPLATSGSDGEIALPALAKVPQPRPANVQKPSLAKISKPGVGSAGRPSSTDLAVATSQGYSGLPGVRGLHSQAATADVLAITSMAGVPREQRVAKLCASALQRQLLGASYFPDLVPLVPLELGNVLDVPETAFRTRTIWYDLSFRCEVDTDATRVLSFTFRVGAAIPPEEWARLGLPMSY